ncbi:MAG TPA: GNAT family N-acetyltransferase [Bryobacteraceae bacterium]|jgi:RimJ/RimL family protein N-acetyltransferase|nr:GNAT family N-acetyltransferase [Bryobacteraceae bacterium]
MSLELQPHLIGELVELRPLRAEDWERVFAAASDPLVWEQHPARDRYKEEVFREFFRGAMESGGAFAVIDRASGEIIGSTRYYNYDATQSEIEIGFTFLARRHWGGRYNGEMKRLMLEHIFRFLDNVVFRIGPENIRSRRAVEKIGGRLIERPTPPGLERVIYRIRKAAAH